MKDKLQGLVAGLLIGVILTGGTVIAASSTTKIDVIYENLKYFVDGVEKKPKTGQGFIYQGTTYVPLRFAGEALGKPVYWDGKTKTISIGHKEGSSTYLDLIDYARAEGGAANNIEFGKSGEKKFTIANNEYLNGIAVPFASWHSNTVIKYNLNGKYTKLTGYLGIDDSSKNASEYGRIEIIGDTEILYSSPQLVGGDLPSEISVDVTNVQRLEISFINVHENNSYGSAKQIVFAEAKLQ